MADAYNTLPAFVQPYAEGYLQRAQQVSDSPYQAYTGQRVAGFTPWMDQAYQAQAQRAMQGAPVMGAANAELQKTIQGGYLGNNPYLQAQIDQAQGDLARNFNQVQAPRWAVAGQRSGSFGNAGLAMVEQQARNDLSQQMGRIGTDMRGADYANERARQMQAMGMAPGFAQQDYQDINQLQQAGQAYQTQNQRMLDNAYQQFLESRNYPQQQLDVMGNALQRSYGQQAVQQTPSTASQVIGGGLTGLALYNALFGG